MILSPDWKSAVVDVIRHNDRLILVKVVLYGQIINVISAYAPQTGCAQEEKDVFIEDMETLIRSVPATDQIVIGADMNGHVGMKDEAYVHVHGGHGYGQQNTEGGALLEMAQALDLTIVNTCFVKKKEHLITYRSGPYSSQIDFIMMRQGDRKFIRDCKVIPGEPVSKQHRLLVVVMDIRGKKEDKKRRLKPRIRTWKLKGVVMQRFQEEVRSQLDATKEITWQNLRMIILNTAKKLCGVTKGQKRKERESWWWSQEVQIPIANKKKAYKRWQENTLDSDLKAEYRKANKEAKKAVAKAKSESLKQLYDDLNTKEGEEKIFKIAKARQRSRLDKQAVNIIKDKDGKVLADDEDIQNRWRTYFDTLLNEEFPREPMDEARPVEGPEKEITRSEIQEALKRMKNNKAPGPSGMTAEMLRILDLRGIDWLYVILNEFLNEEELPEDMKTSEIVTIYKQKGDALECGNYRGIKLLEVALKLYERVIESRIRERVKIHSNQFGFMPGKGTTDAIFILRQVQEKILEGNNSRYWSFVDLEKAFDRVPREVVYWSLRRKGITEKLIRTVRTMYDGAKTTVRTGKGNTTAFEIRVGVHQGSCLSPLLFIIVMDAVSELIRREVPWDMLYADDLIVAGDSAANLQSSYSQWQQALESKGLKINAAKTETMVCSKNTETLVITDNAGNALKQVETFKYLGSMINAKGGCEADVKHRIGAAWQKWKELSGVLCDKRMPSHIKGKVYKTMVRPVLIYGAETWTLRRSEEELLERTEMRMLRWMLGITLKDRKRNDDVRMTLGVACITDKVREARLRWYGHLLRKEDDDKAKKIMVAEVVGQRSRGRPRKRWFDTVQRDLKMLRLTDEDAGNRTRWKKRIRVADPAPEGAGPTA